MTYHPTCAVCGRSVDPSTDHAAVEVEHGRRDDRNDRDEYYLHDRCAYNVLGQWEEP